jgi:predicted phage-related endonuclease
LSFIDALRRKVNHKPNETERERRYFIGGSDARIIMGNDEAALLRLWQEKRGEIESESLSGNLIVQLGVVTEELNRGWYEANTGQLITDVQMHALICRREVSVTGRRRLRPSVRNGARCARGL